MATQSKVVVYNTTSKRHEPIAAGDTLDPSILPKNIRKLWLGKANYNAVHIGRSQSTAAPSKLVVGARYLVGKGVTTDDFRNVGQGADESVSFIATGTTPAVWTNSNVWRVMEDATLTEYHNTLGFAVSVELRSLSGSVVTVFTTSAPYWLNPLSIYNTSTIAPIDATKARVTQSTTKVVLELI